MRFGYFVQADGLKIFPLTPNHVKGIPTVCVSIEGFCNSSDFFNQDSFSDFFNRGFLEFCLIFALSASLRMSVTNTFFNLRSKIGRQKVRMLVQ